MRYTYFMLRSSVLYSRIAKVALVIWIILLFIGHPLPNQKQIVQEVRDLTPIQAEVSDYDAYSKIIGDVTYSFTPQAEYRISGLVVALYRSDSWFDLSHAFDPAQTVDLCLVWGNNITSGGYRMVNYSHGEWTCYYRWEGNVAPLFDSTAMSNNHLIPSTPVIAKLVSSVNVGDQVQLTGRLVSYSTSVNGAPSSGSRTTSLVRTDMGNGACEIIQVNNVRILKRSLPWRDPLVRVLSILIPLSIFLSLYFDMRRQKERLTQLLRTREPNLQNPTDPRNYMK